jgi:probable HAF family extracellular repeat protein
VSLTATVAVSASTPVMALSAAAAPLPRDYRVVELGSEIEVNALSERGHVTFLRYEPAVDVFRGYRWWRGTAVPLTPDLPPGVGSRPADMNDAGDVVGYRFEYRNFGGPRAFVWRDGATTWFEEYTMGVDIDDRGRVLLNRERDGISYRAGVVVDGREITSPLVLIGSPIWANALGGNGTVVGSAFSIATEDWRGFVWRPGRAPVDIGDLGGGWAEPVHVTEDGSVIGYSATADGAARMFRWRDGRMTDLGTLGGAHTERFYQPGQLDLVNERGEVTGSSQIAEGAYHAFRWRNGRMRDLGTLGGAQSHGLGINENGDVVGVSETADGQWHAFLWRGGHMYDLDGGTGDSAAVAINDRDQILGYRGGIAVLWEPRPTR